MSFKLLHIDIETAPNTAHVWGLFKQNVGLSQLQESSYTLCFAAKWHKKKGVTFRSVQRGGEEAMVMKAWELLDEADALCHYNGKRFDIPTLNKEFLKYGLSPPSPYKQIDLLQVARRQFRFPSNKLDYVAQALGVGKKTQHEGHELWVKCMAGQRKAWADMKAYNIQDAILLEDVYEKLLPWIPTHPNMALYDRSNDEEKCPNCGSTSLIKKGKAYTQVAIYQRYRCTSCGTPIRGRYLTNRKDDTVLKQEA
jgi:DNA polymerase elongation subunit (family B)/DNA-directed RNA polymerase subunit RPC12/RpoP